MREAIFFPIARNAEFEIGIAQFRGAAGRTFMKRFFFAPGLDFETFPPSGHFFAMSHLLDHLRPEEDEIITERSDQGHSIGVRLGDKSKDKESGVGPRDPFDLQGQDKENVNDFFRIEVGEGEEERREKHLVRKLTIGKESGHGGADHSNQKIKGKTKRTPGPLETVADEPEKPESDENQERVRHLGDENVGDESPDFSGANPRDVEREIGIKALIQVDENENKDVEGNDGADQSGDGYEADAPLEFVQKPHRCDQR
jgi:hypothetical protein